MAIGPGNVRYTYAQLEGIWNQAGGNPQHANMAAAIAMAESGGNSAAIGENPSSVDRGLWQINSSNGSLSTFDVMGNARAAVQMSNNGTNWRPWCTAYSDGACGTKGGSYLGAGAPYQQYLQGNVPPDLHAPINGTNAAAGQGSSTQATLVKCSWWEGMIAPGLCIAGEIEGGLKNTPLDIAGTIVNGLIGGLVNPFIQIFAGIAGITAGAVLMGGGIFLIVRDSQAYQNAKGSANQAVGLLGFLAGPEAGAATEAAAKAKAQPQSVNTAGSWRGAQQGAARNELRSRQRQAARAEAKKLTTEQLLEREAARYN